MEDPGEQPRVQRDRATKRRFPKVWLFAGLVVAALVVWAATSIGERPRLEGDSTSATTARPPAAEATQPDTPEATVSAPDDDGTSFTGDADVRPSAGCTAPDPSTTISNAELTVDGSVLARYSVNTPDDDEPAPLLVLVSEPGLPVTDLAATSAAFDVNPGWVHVGVDPLTSPEQLGELGIPQLLDEVTKTQCVDLARVFVVGFGEGGRSAGAAICAAPELMTGAVMVAGWAEPKCSLVPRVAVRIVGSDDDPTADTGTALEEVGGAWAEAVGAGDQTVDGRDEETLVRAWHGPGGVTVETTATVSGGHAWTVSASLAMAALLEDTARNLG